MFKCKAAGKYKAVNGEKWAHVDAALFNLICMNKFDQTMS